MPSDLIYYSDVRCTLEVLTIGTAGIGLLAVWVALGRGYWAIRVFTAILLVALLLPIRAYEPLLFCALAVTATVCTLVVFRCLGARYKVTVSSTKPLGRSAERRVVIASLFFSVVVVIALLVQFVSGNLFGWYDRLLVVALVGSFCFVVSSAVIRRVLSGRTVITRTRREQPLRFHLRDVMLAAAASGLICSQVAWAHSQLVHVHWLGMLLSAGCFTVLTCLACGVVISLRWWSRLLFSLALVAGLTANSFLHAKFGADWAMVSSFFWATSQNQVMMLIGGFTVVTTIVMIIGLSILTFGGCIAVARLQPLSSCGHKGGRIGSRSCVAALLVVYLALTPLYLQMCSKIDPPDNVATESATYVDLSELAIELLTLNPGERPIATLNELGFTNEAEHVAANYHSMDLLLKEPFVVPLDFQHSPDRPFGDVLSDLQAFRSLARAWNNEAEFLIQQQQFDAACQRSEQLLVLGSNLSHGGEMAHSLVGIAVEGIAQAGIAKMRDDISVPQATQLLQRLQAINSSRESMTTTVTRTNAWHDHQETWRFQLHFHVTPVLMSQASDEDRTAPMVLPVLKAYGDAVKRRNVFHRLLQTELALRLFRERHGRIPDQLQELVPEFLSTVPSDPFADPLTIGTAKELDGKLIYRPKGQKYQLYSVGMDGGDDGGNFGTQRDMYSGEFDIDVGTLLR